MPEKTGLEIWHLLTAVGSTLTASIWVFLGLTKSTSKKLDELQDEIHEYKTHVAKNYPSHKALQSCSDNISAHIDASLKTQAAELKLEMEKLHKRTHTACPHFKENSKCD